MTKHVYVRPLNVKTCLCPALKCQNMSMSGLEMSKHVYIRPWNVKTCLNVQPWNVKTCLYSALKCQNMSMSGLETSKYVYLRPWNVKTCLSGLEMSKHVSIWLDILLMISSGLPLRWENPCLFTVYVFGVYRCKYHRCVWTSLSL